MACYTSKVIALVVALFHRASAAGLANQPSVTNAHKGTAGHAPHEEEVAMWKNDPWMRYRMDHEEHPHPDDQFLAQRMAADIRCDVCDAILTQLVGAATKVDEMDELLAGNTHGQHKEPEGHHDKRILTHLHGCNKHVKHELIAEGYDVRNCTAEELKTKPAGTEYCLYMMDKATPEDDHHDYHLHKEALFYACESSVGHWHQEMSEVLLKKLKPASLEKWKTTPTIIINKVCRKIARCAGRKHQHSVEEL